ncbi:hypothetical protein QOZ80_5BG0436550 [Eleusine coracana subsp. coracana]|nr:hypothetical protein QOZ80_5BG0436550 [Eleusine coracana subsp. coracana]
MHNSSGRRLHQCGECDPKPPALLPLPLPLRTPIPPPPPSSPPLPVPLLTVRHLSPCPRWSSWVAAALRDSAFAPALASAAISDAVAASTAAIVLDRSALSALLSLWDPRTHVFRLPGGPATFSLEDALVLAGLPPSGAPLDRALTPEEEDLRIRLVIEKEKIRELHPCARAARRVSAEVWLEWFEGGIRPGEDDELRRLGFFAYWLAFLVTPRLRHRAGELPDRVFALAARLSLGERIALGPAMVANLYADMDKIVASVAAEGSTSRVDVWAPFSLLQVWMWERYKQLRPPPLKAPPFPISSVRALHWSRRKLTSTQEEALWILQDEACFDRRPYLYNSSKWMEPKWFSQDTFLVSCTGKDKPEWFADYIAVISQTVLTGWYGDDMDSSVSYNPQLVARQFGYDQVAPVSSANDFASMGNEVWIPSVGRHGMASDDFVSWYRNRQFDSYQDSEWREAVKNVASLLPLSSNKKNVLEEAAVNQSDGCIAQERNKYIGEGQLAHVKGTQGDETNVIVLGLCACNYVDQKKEKKRRDNFAEDCSSKKNKTMVRNNFKNSILQEVQKYSSIQEDLNPSCDALPQLNSDDDCIVLEPCDKQCDVVNLDDEEQSPLDPEFHDRQLILELDEFVGSGLLSQWEASSDEEEGDGGKRATLKISCKDPYAEAAMREYPLFFEFIPQNPHYRGFVKDQVLGDLAYSGLWFLLISLVKDVVNTSCDTDVSDIAYLMKRAKHLEQLGFNVKHLTARLMEPQIRLKRLQDSMKKLEDARKKEQDAKGVTSLSCHLSKLKQNIQKMERHLDENRQASNSSACDKLNEGIDLVSLEKEVEAAEKFCQAMKDEVASMRTNYSDI